MKAAFSDAPCRLKIVSMFTPTAFHMVLFVSRDYFNHFNQSRSINVCPIAINSIEPMLTRIANGIVRTCCNAVEERSLSCRFSWSQRFPSVPTFITTKCFIPQVDAQQLS